MRAPSSKPPAARSARRPTLAALLVAHVRHGRLAPVATLRTRRTGVRVADDGRTIADVTLDSVAVLDAGRSVGAFAEIEIELVDGDDDDLERLGRTLRKAGAKKSDGTPKLLRVLPPPPRPQAGEDAPAIELLHVLLAEQLRELLRHDPGVRLGDDLEDVHRYPGRHAAQPCADPRDRAAARRPSDAARRRAEVARRGCSARFATATC